MRAPRLKPRQVNLLLELLIVGALLTGLTSWAVGDRWSAWLVVSHAVIGISLLVVAPAKLRGSVATGFRRRRTTRWLSAAFGMLVVLTAALGVLHATGLWFGVGPWTALWTHTLLGFLLVPLFVWHLATRPVHPRPADVDRRAFLGTGIVLGAAAAIYTAQETLTAVTGLAGGGRRVTGSHEVASHDPGRMPAVIWFNDSRPDDTDATSWPLVVGGRPVSVESLWRQSHPVLATLDCTGGWWSEQSWDAVALSTLVGDAHGRSVRVRSQTGYDRYFDLADVDRLYLAVGYGGRPLRPGHGGPVRLVVPGRRGPWWVKWVTSVEPDDRPSWWQPPLPLA